MTRQARGWWSGRRGSTFALLVIVFVLGTAGVARAHWRGAGSGTGSATTDTTADVTLSPGTPSATLYPGGRSDVMFSFHNANAAALHVSSVNLDAGPGNGGFAVDAGHSGCVAPMLSFATQTHAGAGWTVPGRAGGVDGTLAVTLADSLSMGVAAPNSCQGATFTVYLAVGP